MASEDVQTNLRLPADLKDLMAASAAKNNRSLSAEVTYQLRRVYSPDFSLDELEGAELRFKLREFEAQEAVVKTELLTLAYSARAVLDFLRDDIPANEKKFVDMLEAKATVLIDGLADATSDVEGIRMRLATASEALIKCVEAYQVRFHQDENQDLSGMVDSAELTVEMLLKNAKPSARS